MESCQTILDIFELFPREKEQRVQTQVEHLLERAALISSDVGTVSQEIANNRVLRSNERVQL